MTNWIKKLLNIGSNSDRSVEQKGIKYLESMSYPNSVIDFFKIFDQQKKIEVNEVRLSHSLSIKIENEDAIPGYVISPLGYLNIGTTIYGDSYCLDTNTKNPKGDPIVVLASHDEIYEESTPEEIKKAVVKVADSFEEFINLFYTSDLPSSYYDVKQI